MSSGPDKHSAFLDLGNGMKAFADGIADQCEHDWNGPAYYVVGGEVHRDPGITAEIREAATEGGVTCAKCGKLFVPEMY